MEAAMEGTDLLRVSRDGTLDDRARHHGSDRKGRDGRRGNAEFVQPPCELLGRTHVHDSPETHPRVGGSAHRAVFTRGVDRRPRTVVRGQTIRGKASDLELGMACPVPTGHPVVILEQYGPIRRDQHGTERFVAGVERGLREFDATAEVGVVRIVDHLGALRWWAAMLLTAHSQLARAITRDAPVRVSGR